MIVSMVGVRIPFASLLSPVYGADAIWWSFPLGTITSAVLTSLYYRYGGWRRARMLEGPTSELDAATAAEAAEAAV
jgi:Na+-driven multidrug efflux pump